MKILLDHSAPKGLLRYLSAHEAKHTSQVGWEGLVNGELLKAAETNGYIVLVTADKNIEYQHTLADRPIGLLKLSTNNWPTMKPHIPAVVEAIEQVKPGAVLEVFCGKFVPAKHRKPLEP